MQQHPPRTSRHRCQMQTQSSSRSTGKSLSLLFQSTTALTCSRSGLCASDKSLIHDEWADFGVAMHADTKGIAGHEGAGVVVAVGDNMHKLWKVGDRAGMHTHTYTIPPLPQIPWPPSPNCPPPELTPTALQASNGSSPPAAHANSASTASTNCTAPPKRILASRPPAPSNNTASPTAATPRASPTASKTKKRAPSCAAA